MQSASRSEVNKVISSVGLGRRGGLGYLHERLHSKFLSQDRVRTLFSLLFAHCGGRLEKEIGGFFS